MKRFFCLILAVCLMICSLAACDFKFGGLGNEENGTSSESNAQSRSFKSYDSIISLYREMAANAILYDPQKAADGFYNTLFDFDDEQEQAWYNDIFMSCVSYRAKEDRKYGYSIGDIDGNGTEELILMLEDYTILAVFSMRGEMPALLCTFTPYCSGYIDAEGQIYIHESQTPTTTSQRTYQISESNDSLELIGEIGTDHFDLERRSGCYKTVEGERIFITADEYNDIYYQMFQAQPLWDTEIQIKDNAEIRFVPLVLSDCDESTYNLFFSEFIASNPIDSYYENAMQTTGSGLMPSVNWANYWKKEFALTLEQTAVLFDDEADFLEWKAEMLKWEQALALESKTDGEKLSGTLPRGELQYLYGRVIRQKVIELKYDLCTAEHSDNMEYLKWNEYAEQQ